MAKLSIRDLELNNKYLFVRVDFNVPLSESGLQILDDTRIKETLPTLEYALRHHAKVIVASHLGRPKGKPNPKYSLRPVVDRCSITRWVSRSMLPSPPIAWATWLRNWRGNSSRGRCCCWRIYVSTRERKPTTSTSRDNSRTFATSM
jgi:hypothetical protein